MTDLDKIYTFINTFLEWKGHVNTELINIHKDIDQHLLHEDKFEERLRIIEIRIAGYVIIMGILVSIFTYILSKYFAGGS